MYGYYAYHEPVQMLDRLITGECAYGRDVARDDRYDAMASADLTSHFSYPFSASLLDGRRFRTLADMGSGTGRYCVFMADRFPEARFYGVDLSDRAVSEGRARGHESDRVKLRTGDMTKLESIDLGHDGVDVFSFMFVLHEFRDAMVRSTVLLTELTGKPSHEVRKQRRGLFPELKVVHELSDQIIRTPDRWTELFAGAGFRPLVERSNALTDHVAMLFAAAA
jgi:SAM-dependent methyltransferase